MRKVFDRIKETVSDITALELATMELEGMEFQAYHGCLESEQKEGNLFVVDFCGQLDISKAASSDTLENAIDYGKIYDLIAQQMAIPSKLLENVAVRIAEAIRQEFPGFLEIKVRVSKKNPPVAGKVQWSRITVER